MTLPKMNADPATGELLAPLLWFCPACLHPSPEGRAEQIKSIARSHAVDVSEQAPPDPSAFCRGKTLGGSFLPVCRNKQQWVYIAGKCYINEHAASQENFLLMSMLCHRSYTLSVAKQLCKPPSHLSKVLKIHQTEEARQKFCISIELALVPQKAPGRTKGRKGSGDRLTKLSQ